MFAKIARRSPQTTSGCSNPRNEICVVHCHRAFSYASYNMPQTLAKLQVENLAFLNIFSGLFLAMSDKGHNYFLPSCKLSTNQCHNLRRRWT